MDVNPDNRPVPFRNAGPDWGYEFLRRADQLIPKSVFNALLRTGARMSVVLMPRERRNSREYLSAVFGRPARFFEVCRHFQAFTEMFILRLRMAEGRPHRCQPLPSCDEFKALMASQRPALLGTFHFGNSDLLGFLLGTFGRHVHMIRLRVKNSRDTHHLAHRFGKWVTFIWVNDTANLLFAVKQAAQSGSSIALKCDRPEHSSKLEAFQFLGARRLFPFTIYHLAIVFKLPVVFCVGVPDGGDESVLHGSPVFEPDGASKTENLERARIHFQGVLTHLESLVRANPYLWFNFTPLIPIAPTVSASPNAAVAAEASVC
jgi:predicted LPLAT superfamily acyltransferase